MKVVTYIHGRTELLITISPGLIYLQAAGDNNSYLKFWEASAILTCCSKWKCS